MEASAAGLGRPGADRAVVGTYWAAGLCALLAAAAVGAGLNAAYVTAPFAAGFAFVAAQRWLLAWRTLISIILGVILLIPMKRYSLLGGTLPFQIEPYRVMIAAVAIGWAGTLLIDPATRIRRTTFDVPLFMVATALVVSDFTNWGRVSGLQVGGEVVKKLTFFFSYIVLVYLISSVITRRREVDQLVRVLVCCGVVVAIGGLYESYTGYNVFNHIQEIFPPLRLDPTTIPPTSADDRGSRLRIFASSEHPIALSAVFAMLVPMAIYLAHRTGRRRWWAACALLGIGVLATVSRTGILMMVTLLICYACIKPAATRRALPALLPLLVVAHVAVPGAMGALKSAFFPPGGVVAEQQWGSGQNSSGRLADLGPSLKEWERSPLLGDGYGTRITDLDDPRRNALILDDQWLGSLLETGLFGVLSIGWLLARSVRRLGRFGRRDDTAHGWLLAGLAASITSYGVGMFTFDAFNFYQVTLLLFIMLAIGSAALRPERAEHPRPEAP